MDALLFSFFIAALIIGGIVWLMSSFSKSKENYIDQRLQGIDNFSADLIFKSCICDNTTSLNHNRKKVAVEVIKDNISVIKTNRGSQIAGATMGGIL